MVLEAILNPLQAEKRPWEMFFLGVLYSSIAIFIGMIIFGKDSSYVIVFLTVMACFPIIYGAIKLEENKDMTMGPETKLLKEHTKALSFFMFLFFGITISFAIWYTFLPTELTNDIFSAQVRTITEINTKATGSYINPLDIFGVIFFNNMKVLGFCILFAFLYGVGAIFILVWNASVLGTAIGNTVRMGLTSLVAQAGNLSLAGYFQVFSLGVLRYAIHGIPEILAYFIAGLAGGIISIAVIRHDFKSAKFRNVLMDSTDLVVIAVIILFVAAILEVAVTPLLF